MNSQRPWVRRQGGPFRPRLERLESRDCPSCTIFQSGETLVILGDRQANQISIADTREGDVVVSCDRGEPQRFAGGERIVVFAFAGDDEITATFQNPSDPAFHFIAVLGAGDDRLQINWFDPQPDPPSRALRFDIVAGAGSDDVEFNMGDVTIDGQFVINVDGGAGNDNWTMNLGDLMINGEFVMSASGGVGDDDLVVRAILPCISPEGQVRFGLDGGEGDDRLAVLVNGAGDESGSAQILGTLELDLRGDGGDDRAILDIVTLDIRGAVLVHVDGDRGADRAMLQVADDVRVFGLLDVSARGGAGNDILDSFIQPCILPAGRASFLFDGNAGNDRIDVSLTELEIEGQFDLSVLGGIGNDILDSFIVPCVLPAGRGNFVFDGGAGDDRFSVRIEMDADSRGALDVQAFGGLGDDDLTLALYGVDDLALLTALLDGGRGYDTARVTRNVRAVNCEEVTFLDEPR